MYSGSDSLLMRFGYADARMPAAMTAGGATYYLAYDQVGSLKTVADASGTVVKNVGYDSFGNVISDSNPAFHVPFGFAGGLHDQDTGLVRFGYRDYDPDTGRWTAKDPIFFAGGDTYLYGYCVGDPVNLVDPDGLVLSWVTTAAGAGFGAIGGFFYGIGTQMANVIFKGEEFSASGVINATVGGVGTGAFIGMMTGIVGGDPSALFVFAGSAGWTAVVTGAGGFVGGFAEGISGAFSEGISETPSGNSCE